MKSNTFQLREKQIEILKLLYRFRFLNRKQIQKFLKHKDHRLIIQWLNSLTNKEYLKRIYSNKFGENTKPAIYFLAKKARIVLKQQKDTKDAESIKLKENLLKRIYKEDTRTQKFINRCIFIADIYLSLEENIKETKSELTFYAKTDLYGIDYLINPTPDIYFAVKNKSKEQKSRYFLDIFDPDIPRFVAKMRINEYLKYYDSDEWQSNTNKPFPNIILVLPTETLKQYAKRYLIRNVIDYYMDLTFLITTWGQIEESGVRRDVFEEVIEDK